ncbi:hypothetical protein OIE69_04885 [Actinacidiphila glaucinigra]|uniref:hypothetical protein n=1 Tax=Actinacidiphila glaucinigra TaxID=235986 RepID=UPI002DDC5EE9|nr:hypothetical protein [Actinacidiphila glaucinigra]WSD58279.1 hypothetical protein OIE69_04885 [Actinacidiphila glaucinigra]
MKYAVSAALLLLLLTACGGKGAEAGGGPSTSAPAPDASASASRSASAGDPSPGGDANPVDASSFCAFVTDEQSKVEDTGSGVGAQAAPAIDVATWLADHPEHQPCTAADFDAAAQEGCPGPASRSWPPRVTTASWRRSADGRVGTAVRRAPAQRPGRAGGEPTAAGRRSPPRAVRARRRSW